MTNGKRENLQAMESAYIANLWEHSGLTVAIFGLQVFAPQAYAQYQADGIEAELRGSLASAEGLLNLRTIQDGNTLLSLQYWRTNEDLQNYARRMPHMRWWKWLVDNAGNGLGFYHEIYQCKTAEAVYEMGSVPVGPAEFCTITPVSGGEGRSKERQQRFLEATQAG